jgi:hypothetical protein
LPIEPDNNTFTNDNDALNRLQDFLQLHAQGAVLGSLSQIPNSGQHDSVTEVWAVAPYSAAGVEVQRMTATSITVGTATRMLFTPGITA